MIFIPAILSTEIGGKSTIFTANKTNAIVPAEKTTSKQMLSHNWDDCFKTCMVLRVCGVLQYNPYSRECILTPQDETSKQVLYIKNEYEMLTTITCIKGIKALVL